MSLSSCADRDLDLGANGLDGSLPSRISGLSKLTYVLGWVLVATVVTVFIRAFV